MHLVQGRKKQDEIKLIKSVMLREAAGWGLFKIQLTNCIEQVSQFP